MLTAMKKEIVLRKDYLREDGFDGKRIPVKTLYFGGGTPSVLSTGELAGLLDTIRQFYELDPNAEITLEANPDDLTKDYLDDLRQLGFNRLSIGIQSFFDDDLRWMNRRHNAHEAIRSIETARRKGFHNINIDLIYGLPSMTLSRWEDNLAQALALETPHLSAYHLTIEERTVFGRKQARGGAFSVAEEDSVQQFEMLMDVMKNAGYEHYEISNFAKPGFYSRHNSAYWQHKPYLGIGPSAHSYDGQSRQWNCSNNSRYIVTLENATISLSEIQEMKNPGDLTKAVAWFEREQLTPSAKYNDYVLVSLRTIWGADAGYIRTRFGSAFWDIFRRQADSYLFAGYMEEHGGVFTLTRKGKMIADRIASDLFCETP